MPMIRPSLSSLIGRVSNDFAQSLTNGAALLRRSFTYVAARVFAGLAHGLYGAIVWAAEQVIIDRCDGPMLRRWAAVFGMAANPATLAQGSVIFGGAAGAVIPAGTLLVRAADSISGRPAWVYRTDSGGVIGPDGTVTVPVTALDLGAAGNCVAATVVTLPSALAGVAGAAGVAAAGIGGGADEEGTDALRARLLARIRMPPAGGAEHDYIAWAMAVSGVTRVWIKPNAMGPGTVTVRFVMDDAYPDGIPQPVDIGRVFDYVNARRPVTAGLYVVAPILWPVTVRIAGLSPATAEVRAAVEAEIKDLARREWGPSVTIVRTHIAEAISRAAGEWDHNLQLPAANLAVPDNGLPQPVIEWV